MERTGIIEMSTCQNLVKINYSTFQSHYAGFLDLKRTDLHNHVAEFC